MKDYWNHAYRIDPGIKSAKDRAEEQKRKKDKALRDNRKKKKRR